jgi:Glycosyltransferase family 87
VLWDSIPRSRIPLRAVSYDDAMPVQTLRPSERARVKDRPWPELPAELAGESARTRPRWVWAVGVITALGLALRLYQLTRPGLLFGVPQYDDAVYLGSAVRLIGGSFPYRDFVFVQPPGISLLLAPVAALSRLTGTDVGLAVARVMTACAGAASVPLCGLLVRWAGLVVVIVACGIVAIHPDAAHAAQSVFLEPWLVLFTLLGALAAFDHGSLTTSKSRLGWAGVAFGLACAIKIWAAVPALVMIALLAAIRGRHAAVRFLAGLAAAIAVTIGPFFVIAPRAFVEDVVVAQLARVDLSRTGLAHRLDSLLGLSDLSLSNHTIIVASVGLLTAIAGLSVIQWWPRAHRPLALEWFALICVAATLAMFLWPVDYYTHYAAFFVPFFALAASLCAGRLTARVGSLLQARQPASWITSALSALLVLGLTLGVLEGAAVARQHEAGLHGLSPPLAQAREIAPHACVLTDYPAFTIATNHYVASAPGCPAMVDPIGTDYALSHGENALTGAGANPAVVSAWLTAFRHAQYVWLACAATPANGCDRSTSRRIPWTPTILRYFRGHFRPLVAGPRTSYLYVRRAARHS